MSYTPDDNYISTDNASTTLITNGNNYTGTWEQVGAYSDVVVAVKTDQDGYYEIQFSPDGTNVDSTLTRYYRTSQIEPPHRFTITRDYMRVIFYNNSGSDQTYFRLQVSVGKKTPLNVPLDGTVSQDYDATVTRPTVFQYEVAEGLRQGYTTWNKWGYNPDIDTGTSPETVWAYGGTYCPLTTADTLDVVSSDANDDGSPAGTGAQSIVITGVDANYNEISEVVTMNGVTAVTTTNSFLGVNRVAIYAAGSGGVNAGNITIDDTTGSANVMAYMPAGEGVTQQAFFYVPASHTAVMDYLLINAVKTSGGGVPVITIKCWVTSLVSGAQYEVFRYYLDTAREGHVEIRPPQPFPIGEKSLIEFQADTDVNDTAVSLRFSLITVRDKDA